MFIIPVHYQIQAICHLMDELYCHAHNNILSMIANIFSLENTSLDGDIELMLP
jgi:hypothetical protein